MYNKFLFANRHQDVAKCMPGQSLRISVEDAARFLSQAYESDFEVCNTIKVSFFYIVHHLHNSINNVM